MKNKKQIIFIVLLLVMSVIGFLVGYYSKDLSKDNNTNNDNKDNVTEQTPNQSEDKQEKPNIPSEIISIYNNYTNCKYNENTGTCDYTDGTKLTLSLKYADQKIYDVKFTKNDKVIYEKEEYIDGEDADYLKQTETKEINGIYLFKYVNKSEIDAYETTFKIYDSALNIKYDTETQKNTYSLAQSGRISDIDLSNNTFKVYYVITDLMSNGEVYCDLVKKGLAKDKDVVIKIDEITISNDVNIKSTDVTAKEYSSNKKYCNLINDNE